MRSGAFNSNNLFDLSFIKDELITINFGKNSKENISKINKIYNNIDLLNSVNYCIINAGYSAIAESVMMNKPIISIPIGNHAEQWCNAKKIEDENIGNFSNTENLETSYGKFIKNYDYYYYNLMNKKDYHNGGEQAAKIILEF